MEQKIVIKNTSAEGFDPQEGFLTELWQTKGQLPRLSKIGKILYLLREGIRNLYATPTSSLISITTVAASVFILGAVIIVVQNASNFLTKSYDSLALTVFFNEQAKDQEVMDFIEILAKNPKVQSVKYVSKEKAMESLKSDLGESRDFLDGLDADNPLPRSADLFLKPGNVDQIETFFESIANKSIIEDYTSGSPFVTSFKRLMSILGFLAKLGIVISEVVVIFLIANTIKLLIYSRRDEILIMQLIGAADSLIQAPFLISGAAQGVLGALLGLVILKLSFWAVIFELKSFEFFDLASHPMLFLSFGHGLIIILMCAAIGCFGSYFSIGKFLNV